jgi:hypothetical protein
MSTYELCAVRRYAAAITRGPYMPHKVDAMLVPLPWHDHGDCCLAIPAHNEGVYTVRSMQIPNAMTNAVSDKCMYIVAGKHLLIVR